MSKNLNRRGQRESSNAVMSYECLTAFLAEQNAGDLEQDCIKKLGSQQLAFSDLALLSDEDLQLMGFKNKEKREELLRYLSLLPKQKLTWEQITKLDEAEKYNRTIMSRATNHCSKMRHYLNAMNTKLNFDVPDDIVIENKQFASKFLVKALDGLLQATDEVEKHLNEIEKVIDEKSQSNNKKSNNRKSKLKLIFLGSALPLGILGLLWYFKPRHSLPLSFLQSKSTNFLWNVY